MNKDKKLIRNLRAQGVSDTPGLGARGAVIPGSLASSSCDGPHETHREEFEQHGNR